MKNIKISYAPALAWGIFVFVLSVMPGKDFPSIPDWGSLLSFDKIIHMIFYGLLTLLILRGKLKTTNKAVPLLFAVGTAVFSSAYGWFLEWFQGAYCSDRMSDIMDGIANTVGAVLGMFIFLYFQQKNRSYKNA
jgi:VanZ family protein